MTEEMLKQAKEFQNFIVSKAKFELNVTEAIQLNKHLVFYQHTLLPEIEKHIFELKKVFIPEEDKSKKVKK